MEINKVKTLEIILNDFCPSKQELKSFLAANENLRFTGIGMFRLTKIYFQSRRTKNFQARFVVNKIRLIRSTFKNWKGINTTTNRVKFLVRVDDFPHWKCDSSLFLDFAESFYEKNIPFLLGVTPLLSLNPHSISNTKFKPLGEKEMEILRRFPNIEIALHGLTHQTIKKKKTTEFIGLTDGQTSEKIISGIEFLKEKNFSPIAFIAPFDRIDKKNFNIITHFFQIICGSFSSAKYLGFWIFPSVFGNTIYVPSYLPLSGNAETILKYLKTIEEDNIIIPITLHWTNELNNLGKVRELVNFIENKTISWTSLLKFVT